MKFLDNTVGRVRDAYSNRHEPEQLRILVNVYWRVLVGATILIVAAALCYGLWQLADMFSDSREPSDLSANIPTGPVLDATQLDATVTGFAERAAQFQFLKDTPPRVADPSR